MRRAVAGLSQRSGAALLRSGESVSSIRIIGTTLALHAPVRRPFA